MRSYNYNRILDVLEIKVGGLMTMKDIDDHYTKLAEDDSQPRQLLILVDYRDSNIKINLEEAHLAAESLKNALSKYEFIHEAMLISKPFHKLVSELYTEFSDYPNYKSHIFVSKDLAIKWLI